MNALEFQLLLTLIQISPAIAQSIQLATQGTAATPEQFAALVAARNASIAAYAAATNQG